MCVGVCMYVCMYVCRCECECVCEYVCVCVYAHATGSLMVAMQGPGSVPGLWVARVATYDGSY